MIHCDSIHVNERSHSRSSIQKIKSTVNVVKPYCCAANILASQQIQVGIYIPDTKRVISQVGMVVSQVGMVWYSSLRATQDCCVKAHWSKQSLNYEWWVMKRRMNQKEGKRNDERVCARWGGNTHRTCSDASLLASAVLWCVRLHEVDLVFRVLILLCVFFL